MRRSSTERRRLLAKIPAFLSSEPLPPPPDSCLRPRHKPHRRRRIRSPTFSVPRPKKVRAASSGRRSVPTTLSLLCKFEDDSRPDPVPESGRKPRRGKERNAAPSVSARKLAACMWRFEIPYICNPDSSDLHTDGRDEFSCNIQIHNQKNGILHKDSPNYKSKIEDKHIRLMFNGILTHWFSAPQLEPVVRFLNPAMERATKWDPVFVKASNEAYGLSNHPNAVDGRQVVASTFVSTLYEELQQSRICIRELEEERQSSKQKMDHFLRKLAEEKLSWRSREHEKVQAIIDGMKDDLKRERKNRKQMEIVNSKLVSELADARLSEKRYLQDYEKEQKARELVEEVCNELAKEIGEEKVRVEALKRESVKIREEVEEERRMLQMAEVWREERVQMKLIDAKVTLEEKYSQLSKLKADLKVFLRARSSTSLEPSELREADALREAVDSVKLQDIKEFSYQPPPASEDIFAVFQKLQRSEETNETDTEPCYEYSPASDASKMHAVSPATDIFLGKPTKRYDNRLFDRSVDGEDDSGWETLSHDEDNGSSNSLGGSEPSINGMCDERNASVSETDWDEIGDNGRLNCEIVVCSLTARDSRKKSYSTLRPWHSSCSMNGENYSKISLEAANGRMLDGNTCNGALSSDKGLGEVGLSSPGIGQWSSVVSVNACKTRGMKGCIEWPRAMQKKSLKAKLLEARMESQKLQLCHALKRKI